MTAIFGLYMKRVWHRIPFAEVLIQIASNIIQKHPGVIYTALLMLAAQVIWILVWANTVAVLLESGEVEEAALSEDESYLTESYIFFLALMMSLYWNLETFKNICHTTVCGVAAGWYVDIYILLVRCHQSQSVLCEIMW